MRLAQASMAIFAMYMLQVQVAFSQHIWTGNQSSDYEFAGNWNPASVPDLGTDVILIKTGASVVYDGKVGVNLNANFEIEQGAEFQASLGGCPENQ